MIEEYVRRMNIERFEYLLRIERDPGKRATIARLLEEERATGEPDRTDAFREGARVR